MDMLHSREWENLSDSGSSDDAEELDFLYGGQASDILSNLEESIGKIDDFLSFDRAFVLGDIVCSITNLSGQMGRVINVKMSVDLENLSGKIVKDVDSKSLLKVHSISVGDFVIHGPWIGRVAKVVDRVIVLFDDGTECEVTATNQEKLVPVSLHSLDDSPYPYYPGQRVQVQLSSAYKSARWLCGTSRENHDTGTVSAVKAGLVYVDWLASALAGCSLSLPAPQRLQNAENLTVLPCFMHENWQLGDWCIHSKADCKGEREPIISYKSVLSLIKEQKGMEKAFERKISHANFQDVCVIVKTKTVVDVEWQDGTCSLGLDSQSVVPVNVVNSHEFWPGQFVQGIGTWNDSNVSSNQKWGVVIGVDAKERTVKVNWKSTSMNEAHEGRNDLTEEEVVSAYELDEHPDYSFCFGDIVFKNVNQTNMDNADVLNGDDYIQNVQNSKAYLSSIGCVTGFKDRTVLVTWASGIETNVAPDEIFRIDKSEGSAISLQHDSDSGEPDQPTANQYKDSTIKENGWSNSSETSKDCENQWEISLPFFPQSAVGFFTNIVASLFGSFGAPSKLTSLSSECVTEEGNHSKTLEEMQSLVSLKVQRPDNANLEQDEDIYEDEALESLSASKTLERFQQFYMVGDCPDHHFFYVSGKGTTISQVKRGWLKKVQQEWSILEKDLPESIYVRTFEDRMDLLRAAIVGAPGTPYHNGLFFFDIHLPPQYPDEPPLVHYISGGLRINPNLYESGKICLSLLNTWTGTGIEVWNPERSNVLQVLLSLQALVLNDKPYFNEAGYDKQMGKVEGEKNSVNYNENVFLLTWKSMLYLLRRTPKHFEALVEEHLKQRSQDILSACKAYMDGTPVAYARGHGRADYENQNGSSTGFNLMLAKLFPKLVEAFTEKGIDCTPYK